MSWGDRADSRICSGCVVHPARRAVLKAAIGLGLGVAAAPAWAQSGEPRRQRPQPGDVLVRVAGEPQGQPLRPDDLPVGDPPLMAWAMETGSGTVRNGSRLNKVLLLRLDPSTLGAETKQGAAEGVVAYSAVCTHTGCDVTGWHADRQILECPCHFSQFDPKQDAKVVGGPAPRGLAFLPLELRDGRLTVARPFQGRVGFQQA